MTVVTVNLADVALAAIVTEEGTVTPVAVVDRLTANPPPAAAELIDAVQVDDAPGAMLAGLQVRVESTGVVRAAVRAIEAVFEEPLRDAVTVAV